MEKENSNKNESFVRPENLVEAIFGKGDLRPLGEEERAMQKLLIEEYKKRETSVLIEVRKLREEQPKLSHGECIRILYNKLESGE